MQKKLDLILLNYIVQMDFYWISFYEISQTKERMNMVVALKIDADYH